MSIRQPSCPEVSRVLREIRHLTRQRQRTQMAESGTCPGGQDSLEDSCRASWARTCRTNVESYFKDTIFSAIALPTSLVRAFPPRSYVNTFPSLRIEVVAFSTRFAALLSPR